MARSFLLSLAFVLLVGSASAQNFPIHVRSVDLGNEDRQTSLNNEVGNALRSDLEWRGIPSEGQGMHLYFRAEELQLNEGNLVVLSLVEAQALPERVIEAGAKSEIWYAGRTLPENVEEGKFVREYLTREILNNQAQVTNIVQLAFPRAELTTAVTDYFDSFFERIRCSRPGAECI